MKQFAVIGNPVKHSKSPLIHGQFAKASDISISYEAIEVAEGEFHTVVRKLFEQGLTGANVTMPFKGDAYDFADKLTDRAKQAKAVNTLWRNDEGIIIGDTTDGIGLVAAIAELEHYELNGKSALILGAGGAVRGIVQPLLDAGVSHVDIANRTVSKAEAIAQMFDRADALSLANINQHYDLIINGTSASLTGASLPVQASQLAGAELLIDMTYQSEPTPIMQMAKSVGVTAVDGMGMLLGQAAESFNIWHGVKPDINDCLTAIRHKLS